MEREGRERIDHTITANVCAVGGFNTDDGDDHFRRHAIGVGGTQHGRLVGTPERSTVANALIGDEDSAVLVPGFDLLGRLGDQLDDAIDTVDVGKRAAQVGGIEAMLFIHVVDETLHRRGVERGRWRIVADAQ